MTSSSKAITIYICPRDVDHWLMVKENESMSVYEETTIIEFFHMISEQRRHISPHRIHAYVNNNIVPDKRLTWNLRKLGITDGATVIIRK